MQKRALILAVALGKKWFKFTKGCIAIKRQIHHKMKYQINNILTHQTASKTFVAKGLQDVPLAASVFFLQK